MKSVSEERNRNQFPEDISRCVWMTAGILSYQLCDRQFDCDTCPLDAAMRMHYARTRTSHIAHPPRLSYPETLLFSRNHCWIDSLCDTRVRIGVEGGFAEILASPKAVVLPAVGEKVSQGQLCVWVVLNDETLPFRSPLSGSISSVNIRLSEQPSVLSTSPYEDGWLFEAEIKADEQLRSRLMNKNDAERIFEKEMARFRGCIQEAMNRHALDGGKTLQDGGAFAGSIAAMLGGKRYLEIVREAFRV